MSCNYVLKFGVLLILFIQGAFCDDNLLSLSFADLGLFNVPSFLNFNVTTENSDSLLNINLAKSRKDIDPNILEDAKLTTPQLISKYGYPVEIHHIVTEDGYILEVHRIVRVGAIPVLMTHGLLDSSATWVIMGPARGLAYLLHDEGYDIWLANVRGNTYSRNHTKYSTGHAKFWDFSFHEMGKYDMPATIDYILNNTNAEKLHYIGHSQGTAIFWIMCSEQPEYSDKILLMQALAPIAFIKHAKSPVVVFLSLFQDPLSILFRLIGAHEFLPKDEFILQFGKYICDEDVVTREVCTNVMFLLAGFDRAQTNETMLPVILGHNPAGAATKQMQHFAQLKSSGHFRQFDYGWLRNHWRYDSISPPDYNIKNVRNKVALHYSLNDWLSSVIDVQHLDVLLPNVVEKHLVDYPNFNHLDFIWGIDAKELLFNRVIQLMDDAETNDS